jgi:hypothetical protein
MCTGLITISHRTPIIVVEFGYEDDNYEGIWGCGSGSSSGRSGPAPCDADRLALRASCGPRKTRKVSWALSFALAMRRESGEVFTMRAVTSWVCFTIPLGNTPDCSYVSQSTASLPPFPLIARASRISTKGGSRSTTASSVRRYKHEVLFARYVPVHVHGDRSEGVLPIRRQDDQPMTQHRHRIPA